GACSILVQLRTGHIALNFYLHRFARHNTPLCPTCEEPETVEHFILDCARYRRERSTLMNKLATTNPGGDPFNITNILSNPEAHKPLIKFLTATERFPLNLPIPDPNPPASRRPTSRPL
ncbi:hypothetical protein FRC01_006320, partial [Tulasnella sp. 417]